MISINSVPLDFRYIYAGALLMIIILYALAEHNERIPIKRPCSVRRFTDHLIPLYNMEEGQYITSTMIAACGIPCDRCEIHLRDKKPCHACLKACGNKPIICSKCNIANCARSKGLTYCHECSDFPCQNLKNADQNYQDQFQVSMITRSNLLKENGMTAYIEYLNR